MYISHSHTFDFTLLLETKKLFLENFDSLILHVTIKHKFGHLFLGINKGKRGSDLEAPQKLPGHS